MLSLVKRQHGWLRQDWSGLARGWERQLTTARPSKIPLRNWVENVAPLCLRGDLAVVATNRQRYICS